MIPILQARSMRLRAEVTCSRSSVRSSLAAPGIFSSHYAGGSTAPVLCSCPISRGPKFHTHPTPPRGTGPESSTSNSSLWLTCFPWALGELASFNTPLILACSTLHLIQFAFSGAQLASRLLLKCSLQSRGTTVTPILLTYFLLWALPPGLLM